MSTTENKPSVGAEKYRPDLFVHTLNMLRYGEAGEEASKTFHEAHERARLTGKVAKITVELSIRPQASSGQYYIDDKITAKLPPVPKESTLLFGTPDGNFQREDPRQNKLELRQVETAPAARVVDAAQAHPTRVVGA